MSSISYSLVMSFHALFAAVAFGTLGLTGAYARATRSTSEPLTKANLARYFRPGRALSAWAIVLVPILGVLLIVMGHGRALHFVYPWIGISLWVLACGFMTAMILPGRRVLQEYFAGSIELDRRALFSTCRRIELGAMMTSLLFVGALVDMVGRPH